MHDDRLVTVKKDSNKYKTIFVEFDKNKKELAIEKV